MSNESTGVVRSFPNLQSPDRVKLQDTPSGPSRGLPVAGLRGGALGCLLAISFGAAACSSGKGAQGTPASDAATPVPTAAPSVEEPPLPTPPSCKSTTTSCGLSRDQDCCSNLVVPGGSFLQVYDGVNALDKSHPATITAYRLDRYEVTRERFQQFLASYDGTPPTPGSGKNPNTVGDLGWNPEWDQYLPPDAASFEALLDCDSSDMSGDDPTVPARCISWYEAFAFCVWDEGRLPTWLEWYYAAAGGREQRAFPWSDPPTQYEIDATRAVYASAAPLPVGSKPAGDGRFGHSDLAGNLAEMVLDVPPALLATECNDCQYFSETYGGLVDEGYYTENGLYLSNASYGGMYRGDRFAYVGFRCARPGPDSKPVDAPPPASASVTASMPPAGSPIAKEDYAQAFADLVCENMGPCCELRRSTLDVERCKATETQRQNYYLTNFPNTLEFDPAAAGECYARTQSWIEQCITPTEADLAACRAVYRGLIPAQEPCDYDFECALGPDGVASECVYVGSARICRPKVPLPIRHDGEDCSGTSVSCDPAEGLVCLVESGVCGVPRSEGGACASGVDCNDGTWCDTEQGLCLARPATGACPNSGSCALTSYCNVDFQCIPQREDRADCSLNEECLSEYCREGKCGPAVYASPSFCDSSQPVYGL